MAEKRFKPVSVQFSAEKIHWGFNPKGKKIFGFRLIIPIFRKKNTAKVSGK